MVTRIGVFASALVTLLSLHGCDCSAPPDGGSCESSDDCAPTHACVDGRCRPRADANVPGLDGGPTGDAAVCASGERVCGASCCASGEVCGSDTMCCPRASLCGDRCCGDAEVCEGAICHLDCGERARCRDESGAEICCGDGEVCASGQCFLPATTCTDYVDCPEETYCEPTTGTCMPQPGGESCADVPTGGEVRPTVVWHWDGTGRPLYRYNQVMMTPVVANLTDDDGDGDVDLDDVPDVIFSTFCGVNDGSCAFGDYNRYGVLRAVSGDDGSPIFDIVDSDLRVIGGAQLAVGDIDGDGLVEIIACGSDESREGPLLAFENDGTFKWRSADPRVRCGQSAPGIADLDGDGQPEVFIRYSVLNGADGTVQWHNDCAYEGSYGTHQHLPCDYTTAADLDGDGQLELVGGHVAFDTDGSVLWDRRAERYDGYPAIGDLDLDGTPEIVVVHSAFHSSGVGDHFVRALRADGTDLWGPINLNFLAPAGSEDAWGGGPPTIANFDDDPNPEIALAGGYGYVVLEHDGTLKWTMPTRDLSSRKTGSSVFDFDGDGVAEAVYNDEYWLRVYNGPDGTVRYCECNPSATHWEYPVIADVNNDGHAEIVLAANDYGRPSCPAESALDECTMARVRAGEVAGVHGVRVFASPARDWVATRRIWNQHTYHVTNVTEAGGIPTRERPSWSSRGLNNFRQNVQPGATNLPDLVPTELSVDLRACPEQMTLFFRVHNDGWAAAPAGVGVTVYARPAGAPSVRLGRLMTTRALLPGESELLSIPYDRTGRPPGEEVEFRVVVDDPEDAPSDTLRECVTDNNTATILASCQVLI